MNSSTKYWVACSGGVDSVVLLHLMCMTRKNVGIVHCNFHLRGASSNQDEKFVRKLAEELSIPIKVKEFDTKNYSKKKKINTQLAARELRYNWFDCILEKEGGIVLLAHHYDDQVETFFLQLRRGGKVRSLAGMPAFRNGYARPILNYSKSELIELASSQGWEWREDITNKSNDYTRNWYRNKILPWLKTIHFPMEEVVPIVQLFQQILDHLETFVVPDSIQIDDWNQLTIWEKEHILFVQNMGEYSSSEIDKLTIAEKGKFFGNDKMKLWNEGKELIFVAQSEKEIQYELSISLISKDEIKMNQNELFLDASKVKGKISVRKWQPGDRFQPLGMKGEKTVGKFLRDRKVATHLKENIQVLETEQGEIVGIFGFGISERMKVEPTTRDVLKLCLLEQVQ